MKEYKVWAFARSAAPNLPALEEQLADVMREADRRGYIIVNYCMEQKYGPSSGDLICSPCSPPCSRGASMPSWCRALTD